MRKIILAFSLSFITIEAIGFSEKEFKEQLEESVQSYLKEYNPAGLAIAVLKKSFDIEKPYQKKFCFGYSKRSTKSPIKEFTLFRIGGLSKTFLASLVMQYAAEGKLSLKEPISKYVSKTFAIPKFHGEEIKLIDLAMHGSAIPSVPTIPMKLYEVSELDIRNYFKMYKLSRSPGKKYEESDLGYSLIAHILSRLEKTSYRNLLLEKVLKPLEMNDTYYSIPLSKLNYLATGYKGIAEVGDQFIDRDGSFFKPCRGLISNIDNLSKWLSFLLKETKTPLNDGLKTLYNTVHTFPDTPLKKRAPGFSVEPLSFKTSLLTYREGGIYNGFSYSIAFIPATKTGVVIVSNTEYEVERLATTILELLNQ